MCNECTQRSTKCNLVALQYCHYYALDQVALAELPQLKSRIISHFRSVVKLTCRTIQTWIEKILDGAQAHKKHSHGKKSVKKPNKLLQKVADTLTAAREIGTIYICGAEIDVREEITNMFAFILQSVFFGSPAVPPCELLLRFQRMKWSLHYLCSAGHINFNSFQKKFMVVSGDSAGMGHLLLQYRNRYTEIARSVLNKAFFSSSQGMFVPVDVKGPTASQIYDYLSPAAIRALQTVLGTEGMKVIFDGLTTVVGKLTRSLVESLEKVLAGKPEQFDSGLCPLQNSGDIIQSISHISAILKLRETFRALAGIENRPPHEDEDMLGQMNEAGVNRIIDHPILTTVLGSLMASNYWESFSYDTVHDAMRDNSHIWACLLDCFAGCADGGSHNADIPELFYRQLFGRFVLSIRKAKEAFGKKGKSLYPGMSMVILVENIANRSYYADYSELEPFVPYQFIRTLYMERLSKRTEA
jgi:hypothetical protein